MDTRAPWVKPRVGERGRAAGGDRELGLPEARQTGRSLGGSPTNNMARFQGCCGLGATVPFLYSRGVSVARLLSPHLTVSRNVMCCVKDRWLRF